MSRPDESGLSKRERQKLRREQKRQAEQAAAARARRRRKATSGLLVALTVGLLGYFIFGLVSSALTDRRLRAEAAGRLDEFGCTEVAQQPSLGGGHLDQGALAGNPPDQLYPDRPTASGQHLGSVVQSGVYDTVVDERVTTHNLEHGYVVFWYDEESPAEEVAELKEFARERIGGTYPKLVVAQYYEPLPEGVNFSIVAWQARQDCEQFDAGVALNFMDDHYGLEGVAPERELAPHLDAGSGVLTTEGNEPLLLPPLGETDASDATEQPADSTERPGATEGAGAATEQIGPTEPPTE